MADTPGQTKAATSSMPYIWAGLILILMSGLFILSLLFLRPNLDPLLLITAVIGMMTTVFTGVAAYLKSQETHLTVNSQLSAWKAEFFQMAHSKGVIEGTDKEQARIAEVARVKALTLPLQRSTDRVIQEIPVKVAVVNTPNEPVPVADHATKK